MIQTIPLQNGNAFTRFSVNLNNTLVTFRIRWQTRYGLFLVDLLDGNTVIVAGRGLHPDIDLLGGTVNDIGRIWLEGEAPTIANLGVGNKLRYEAHNA